MMTNIWRVLGMLLFILNFSIGYPSSGVEKDSRKVVLQDPEESGGFFEGDIDLTDEQLLGLRSRNGLIARSKRWPNKLVVYKISPQFDPIHKSYIQKAIRTIEAATCVRFREATPTDTKYINITAEDTGCHSQVGYLQKVQRMNLQKFPIDEGCFRMGSILHEFLHTLGFYHQQSASDRDDYITVVVENITPGMEDNFRQQTATENFGIAYDYNSVLHYSSMAFSKNGKKTIITRDPKAVIGQRKALSAKDIAKLNTMYLCPMQT
ncbi:seminal metalloprotease 1-like [Eupeodes corollae]|uniref:seminal metalloprotease 1-like n=1 Tax=Eupeodes corollae TaxID=290404 RepID=UPI0024926312|nr:seminal metalloprotease 1-like [Eupeodes corollae]